MSHVSCLMSRQGLTFVELLIAGAIFAILLVGLSAHLRGNVMAWHRATTTVEQLQQVRVALERWEADLAGGLVFDPGGAWMPQQTFDSTRVQWYVVRPGQAGSSATGRVWFVTYELQPDGQGMALTRSSQTVAQAASTIAAVPERLLRDVQSLVIRYGSVASSAESAGQPQTITWTSSWTDLTQTPRLIEVTLELGSHWAITRQLRQVFVIPSGSLTPQVAGSP